MEGRDSDAENADCENRVGATQEKHKGRHFSGETVCFSATLVNFGPGWTNFGLI